MATTQLFATTSAEENWSAVVEPWLRQQAASAWQEVRPTVVMTPSRAEGFYLRSRLVAAQAPLLGIRFWTPSDARKFLLAHYLPGLGPATQAELRLLARLCAERLAQRDSENRASLHSVVREPAAFLRAYDLLLGAGWNPARDGAEYGRELALELQRELDKCRIATQAGLHRDLWRASAATGSLPVANLLVTGFNAAHWPLWDLLKAAVLSADQAVVALSQPRVFAESVDQLWIGSWEDFTQTEAQIPEASLEVPTAPFASLAKSYETGACELLPKMDLTFCVTPDLASQTRGVVLRALDFLQREECTRLGIVFPQANALALGVAEQLRERNIPINDGLGVLKPGLFEKRCWQTWLDLQDEPGVPRLIAWLRACQAGGLAMGAPHGPSAETIVNLVESALGETLVDDLDFLAGHLEEQRGKFNASDVAAFLRQRVALPPEASFSRFLDLTDTALALPGWDAYRAQVELAPPAWLRKSNPALTRRAFLEWLREATNSQTRVRAKDANHFYGKVHLLVYGQISGQTWSHLILTGLNEGVWPRTFEAGAFGSRRELDALNKQARSLNRRGKIEGAQGEGHPTVHDGFGHCLLPLERHDLGLRDLCTALEGTTHAVCLAATATEAGRALLPSDFFNHAYQVKTGSTLDEESFRRLASATQAWCLRHDALFARAGEAPVASIESTREAHAFRRDPSRPFGAYEFAYDRPPERPIQLWSKEWEEVWNHPAKVWLESVIGAAPWPDGRLSWPRAVGTWVHHWLAQALRDSSEQESSALVPLVEEAAQRTSRRMHEHARAQNLELYPWWLQIWAQARTIAVDLGENLEPFLPGRSFAAEYRIPSGIVTALPGSEHADFELKGRIDLLLFPSEADVDPAENNFADTPCWVIDFKTGSAKALTAKDALKGRGLQPLLYALAMRSLGASGVAVSLLTRNTPLKEQLALDDMLKEESLFRSLEIMHRSGVLGMKPDAENEYGFSPAYPLATRFIARYVLEAKWALVHGGTPGEGEDDS